jgi:arylsulfatase
MIRRLDWNVGRLMAQLEASGERDNTVVIFISDNGAEGHLMEAYPSFVPWLAANYDNSYANIGRKGSFVSLGPGWAHAANGPLRLYKGYMSEGGTRVPAILNFGGLPVTGSVSSAYATVMDLAPTLLDLANAPRPGAIYGGRDVLPMRGVSLQPLLMNDRNYVHLPGESIGWELFGRRVLQRGDWKALWLTPPHGPGTWELFDTTVDPGETVNLAERHPAVLAELAADWEAYARSSGVILPSEPVGY